VHLGGGKTITTAEGQTVLVVVRGNPLAEDILAVWPGCAVELNGHKNEIKRKEVGILATAIQAVNGK